VQPNKNFGIKYLSHGRVHSERAGVEPFASIIGVDASDPPHNPVAARRICRWLTEPPKSQLNYLGQNTAWFEKISL
jgi:hypothetical protein